MTWWFWEAGNDREAFLHPTVISRHLLSPLGCEFAAGVRIFDDFSRRTFSLWLQLQCLLIIRLGVSFDCRFVQFCCLSPLGRR